MSTLSNQELSKKSATDELVVLRNYLLESLDEQIFFQTLAEFLRKKIEAEAVSILKVLDDGQSTLVSAPGLHEWQLAESLMSHVVRTKRAYYSNNVKRDPLFSDSPFKEAVAHLSVPVNCQGRVIATLHFQHKSEGKKFSDEEITTIISYLSELQSPLRNMNMLLLAQSMNVSLLKKIEEKEKELNQKKRPQSMIKSHFKDIPMIGQSKSFLALMEIVKKIANNNATILIQGQSGTGKELVARKIHGLSERADNAYVVVNCGALQENLLESELFGHKRGSFTGAIQDKEGLVELAHEGTLFLDEVAELSKGMQSKLLRFLQEKEACRVGDSIHYQVDVRIIAATNKDLKLEVEKGNFREDLYYRLSALRVDVPNLKERKEDIKLLAEYYLNRHRDAAHQKSLTEGALNCLVQYTWPGNIRELRNMMEKVFIMSEGDFIGEQDLPELLVIGTENEGPSFIGLTLEEVEKKHIIDTLKHAQGNKTKASKMLGITVKTLYNKLHDYEVVL